jgi:phage gp37-like protein
MTALMLAAEAAKAESSHTAFYIAGGALAAWAVIVSFLGITRPAFPGTMGARNAVIAISAVLVLGATSMAVITAG